MLLNREALTNNIEADLASRNANATTLEANDTAVRALIPAHNAEVSAHGLNVAATVGALPIPDAGGYFATDTIGAALQEVAGKIALVPASGAVMRNLANNGDFSNGVAGWLLNETAASVNLGKLTIVGQGNTEYMAISQAVTIPDPAGKKLYFRTKQKVTNAICTRVRIAFYQGDWMSELTVTGQTNPVENQEYTLSGIVTLPSGWTPDSKVFLAAEYASPAAQLGKVMEVQYVSLLDLTAIFGAGKEPTLAQMDRIMSFYPNNFFDGNASITELLRASLASVIADEPWITPTLLNGHVGVNGTPQYSKDAAGWVHFRGGINGAGASTNQALSMPAGYRPSADMYFSDIKASVFALIYPNGTMAIENTKGWIALSQITYLAEA